MAEDICAGKLLFGKNNVVVPVGKQKESLYVPGYFTMKDSPTCGCEFCWISNQNLEDGNFGGIDTIRVLVHNIKRLHLIAYNTEDPPPWLNLQQQHVVTENYHELRIETVDGATLPYMGFARGGLHCLLEVVAERYETAVESYGSMPAIHATRTSIRMNAPKQSIPVTPRYAHPTAPCVPRCAVCSTYLNDADGPKRPPRKASIPKALFRAFAGASISEDEDDPILTEFERRRLQSQLHKTFIAWRLFIYRQRKLRVEIAQLFVPSPKIHADLSSPPCTGWSSLLAPNGSVVDASAAAALIYHHILPRLPSERIDRWRFLLSQHASKAPLSNQLSERTAQKENYYCLLEDTMARLKTCPDFATACETIEVDLQRVDTSCSFYDDDHAANRQILSNIMRVYLHTTYPAAPYVQGMLDVAEVVLYVMQDESDAFTCYCNYMAKEAHRFDQQSDQGIHDHLKDLRELIQFLDLELYAHLVKIDADNMYFAFRWLLVDFKREAPMESVVDFWETMLAARIVIAPRYHLFANFAFLSMYRKRILLCQGFGEVMMVFQHSQVDLDALAIESMHVAATTYASLSH